MVFNKLGHYVYKILHKKYCFITSIAFDESVFYCTNGSIFFYGLWICMCFLKPHFCLQTENPKENE